MADKIEAEIMGTTTLPEHTGNVAPAPKTVDPNSVQSYLDNKEEIVDSVTGLTQTTKEAGWAENDTAQNTFSLLFGENWHNWFEGNTLANSFFSKIFAVLTDGVLTVCIIAVIYIIIISFISTAKDGSVFGKKRHSFWGPVKLFTGLLLILPFFGGYSLSQTAFLSVIVGESTKFSNKIAGKGVDMLTSGISIMKPIPNDPTNLLKKMYYNEVCYAYQSSQTHDKKSIRVVTVKSIDNDLEFNFQNEYIDYDNGTLALKHSDMNSYAEYICKKRNEEAWLGKINVEACKRGLIKRHNFEKYDYGVYGRDAANIEACGSWTMECPNPDFLTVVNADSIKRIGDNLYSSECNRRALAYLNASDKLSRLAAKQVKLADASMGENTEKNSITTNELNCQHYLSARKDPKLAGALEETKISTFNKIACEFKRDLHGNQVVYNKTIKSPTLTEITTERTKAIKAAEVALVDRIKNNGFLSLISLYYSIGAINNKMLSLNNIEPTIRMNSKDITNFDSGLAPQLNKAEKYLQQNARHINEGKNSVRELNEKFSYAAQQINPSDPLVSLMEYGASLIDITSGYYAATKALGVFIGGDSSKKDAAEKLLKGGYKGVDFKAKAALAAFGGLLTTFSTIALIAGLIMVFFLGFMPFLNWVSAFIGWIFSVFAVMLALPFWCVGLMFPDGESLLDGQYVRQGILVLINIALKPISMVIGFWFAYIFMFMGTSFVLMIGQWFLIDQLDSQAADLGFVAPFLAPFVVSLIMAILVVIIIQRTHTAYYKLDDMIMRGLGAQGLVFGEEIDERNSVIMFSSIQRRMSMVQMISR